MAENTISERKMCKSSEATNNFQSIELRVAEAKQRDVGRGKVRIDIKVMRKLGVSPGDTVEIEGKRKTAAIVWPAYPEDQDMRIIRMDELIRKNAGVSIGEKVIVRKAKARPALIIKLLSAYTITVDDEFVNFVKKRLYDYPLTQGDTILIPVLGQAIPFTVTFTYPKGAVYITEESHVLIAEREDKLKIVNIMNIDKLSVSVKEVNREYSIVMDKVKVTFSMNLNYENITARAYITVEIDRDKFAEKLLQARNLILEKLHKRLLDLKTKIENIVPVKIDLTESIIIWTIGLEKEVKETLNLPAKIKLY